MELVSIIIPTYGGGEYLIRSIESAFSQDYSNIEVIVVDDNGEGTKSQISTQKRIEKYLSMNNFTYILHEKNINGSAARNTGAKRASGKYLNFLDDDDAFLPGKIKFQVEQLEKLSSIWGGSYSSRITTISGKTVHKRKAKESGAFLYKYMMHSASIGTGALLIRKSVWDDINGYDELFERHQDWEFTARVLDKYKLIAAEKACFERNYLGRFTPKSAEKNEKLMDFFLENMIHSLTSLSTGEFKKIKTNNYMGIALKYLKQKKIKQFLRIYRKHGNGALGVFFVLRITIKYFISKITGNRWATSL